MAASRLLGQVQQRCTGRKVLVQHGSHRSRIITGPLALSHPLPVTSLVPCRHASLLRRPHRPYTFTQLVTFSDGSSALQRTTSPSPVYRTTKDTRNNPLWNPTSLSLANVEEDEAGRLRAFRKKFGRGWDADADADEDELDDDDDDPQDADSNGLEAPRARSETAGRAGAGADAAGGGGLMDLIRDFGVEAEHDQTGHGKQREDSKAGPKGKTR